MTVDEWAQEQMQLIQLFVLWWKANQRQGSKHFPEQLLPGEWDEQAQNFDPSDTGSGR